MVEFPAPGIKLNIEFATWPADRKIHRVHNAAFGATEFNATGLGNARFSPIANAAGEPVPTLYGGTSFECALMETLFHDIPHTPGFKIYDKEHLRSQRASLLCPARDLRLANLSGKALRKIGIPRVMLLECDAADYPRTRPWAQAIHAQFPEADGLLWVSRQDDEAHAVMVFGDRVKEGSLRVAQPPTDIEGDPILYDQMLTLAQVIGVEIL